jgi:transcriptional regulator with XRE-family HTH domain
MIGPMEKLRTWLTKSDTTQLEFAKSVGVSQPTVSDWLKGVTLPTAANLRTISRLTSIPIDDLLAETKKTSTRSHAAA